jgi:hypothetical protein
MTTTLSVIAVVISTFSLLVSYVAYRRAGPRIVVSVWKAVTAGATTTRVFHVVVHNGGRGPITVRDVGLHAESAKNQVVSVQQLRHAGEVIDGPELQHRIDGNDHGEWLVDGQHAARAFGATTQVRGYAELVRVRARGTYVRKASKWAEFNATP